MESYHFNQFLGNEGFMMTGADSGEFFFSPSERRSPYEDFRRREKIKRETALTKVTRIRALGETSSLPGTAAGGRSN